jgi:hypothetical protein
VCLCGFRLKNDSSDLAISKKDVAKMDIRKRSWRLSLTTLSNLLESPDLQFDFLCCDRRRRVTGLPILAIEKGHFMRTKAILTVLAFLTAVGVLAEANAGAAVDIPAISCEKPGDAPLQPTYDQQKRYDKKREAYKDCVLRYVDDMKKQADAQFETGKKYQDAANGAIDEFNTWANQVNTTLKKDK